MRDSSLPAISGLALLCCSSSRDGSLLRSKAARFCHTFRKSFALSRGCGAQAGHGVQWFIQDGMYCISKAEQEAASMANSKAKKRGRRTRKPARQHHLIGIRLTPAMKDALDEVALEWRTTRSAVMRELLAHALKSPPKLGRKA